MNEQPSYSIDQIARLSAVSVRTIRFWIQSGVVPPPNGSGRGATYGAEHLEAVLRVLRWQAEGLSLDGMRARLEPETDPVLPARRVGSVDVVSRMAVAPGIDLLVDPAAAGLSPDRLRQLFDEVRQAHRRLTDVPDGEGGRTR